MSTSDVLMTALEAVRQVEREFGIPTSKLKPCIAYHLIGGELDVARHDVAFTLAMELRELTGADSRKMEAILAEWARRVGYRHRAATRTVASALQRTSQGAWRWHAPGLKKGPRYGPVLQPICDAVGCPANCPRYSKSFAGLPAENFDRFVALGWQRELHRRRHRASVDVYGALCSREKQLRFAPGAQLFTSYTQLASLAGVDPRTVGRCLRVLDAFGLITFVAGSGSGPKARDRKASCVARVVPIPPVGGAEAATATSAIPTGGGAPPHIGGVAPATPWQRPRGTR